MKSQAKGNDVDACFIMLQRWSHLERPVSGLVSVLEEAGFQTQAKGMQDILSMLIFFLNSRFGVDMTSVFCVSKQCSACYNREHLQF